MQLPELLTISSYAGPPVIGAFIGYVTNRIAIKMLFRPLNPWRIGGLRVPMTPGVIPSKRYELAENIGEMVGDHLLTGKEVGQAISREPFQEHLLSVVDLQLREMTSAGYGTIGSLIDEQYKAALEQSVVGLCNHFSSKVHCFLLTEKGEAWLLNLINAFTEDSGRPRINELLSIETREAGYEYIGEMACDVLSNENTRVTLARLLEKSISDIGEQGRTVRQVIPPQVVEILLSALEQQVPVLMGRLGGRVNDPLINTQIIEGLLKGVDRCLDSLGPVGAMARGFIDMQSLKKTIDEYLVEKEQDIISWLQQPLVTVEVQGMLQKQFDRFLDMEIGQVVELIDEKQVTGLCKGVVDQLCNYAISKNGQGISQLVKTCFESWLVQKNSPITRDSKGKEIYFEDNTDIKSRLQVELVSILRSEYGKNLLDRTMDEVGKGVLTHPLGNLFGCISEQTLVGVRNLVVQKINTTIIKEVPSFVRSLQISRLVKEKINSLDLLRLERLLLSIMEEQFKYINLFGALLGFAIGCINLVLLRLM